MNIICQRFHIKISPTGPATPRGSWEGGIALPHTLFCVAKIKKENKGEKERVSKQKLLKSCHQGQNITVLAILERLELKNISYPRTMVANNTFQRSIVLHFEIHFVGPDY